MAWTKVCEKSEIPVGSIKKVWARIGGGIPIAVAHHKTGYVAIPPVCPHLEEPLEESGLVVGCKLTCTKHLWSWDLETLEQMVQVIPFLRGVVLCGTCRLRVMLV